MDPEEIKRKLEELAEREKAAAKEKKLLEEALKKAEEESKKKAEDEAKKMDGYRGQLRQLEELHAKALEKTGEFEKRIRESYLRQHHLETQIEFLRKKLNGPPSTTPQRQRTSAKAASSSPRKITAGELQHAISWIPGTSKPPLKMKISTKQMKPILEENFEENLEDEDELVGELKLGPQYQKEAEEFQRRKAEIRAIPPVANYERIGNLDRCSRCHYVPKPGKNENFNLKRHIEEKKCEQKTNEYCWAKRQKMKERMVGNEEIGEDGEKKENKKKAGRPKKEEKDGAGKNEDDGKVVKKKKDEDDGPKGELKKLVTVLGTPAHIIGDFDKRISRSQRREQENEERKRKAAVVMARVRKENEEKKRKKMAGGIQWNNAKGDLAELNRLENEKKLIEKKVGDNLDGNRAGNEADLDKFFKTPIQSRLRNVPSNPLPENLLDIEPMVIEPTPKKALPTMRARPGGYIWKQGQEESDKEEDRLVIDEDATDSDSDSSAGEHWQTYIRRARRSQCKPPPEEKGKKNEDDEDDSEGGQIEVVV